MRLICGGARAKTGKVGDNRWREDTLIQEQERKREAINIEEEERLLHLMLNVDASGLKLER